MPLLHRADLVVSPLLHVELCIVHVPVHLRMQCAAIFRTDTCLSRQPSEAVVLSLPSISTVAHPRPWCHQRCSFSVMECTGTCQTTSPVSQWGF